MLSHNINKKILLVGASRGLGLAMAEEFLNLGYHVTATVRTLSKESEINRLLKSFSQTLSIETVDINLCNEVEQLYQQVKTNCFDILFVNAGVKNADSETVADVSNEEFNRVMLTNALSPMRFIEKFRDLVKSDGTIAIMSSGQGSVSNNNKGHFEVYRSSKAALNMFMRSFAARHQQEHRTLLLMAPGWIKTAIGGNSAPLTIQDSIPSLVKVIENNSKKGGLHYLDYQGNIVPW